MAKAFENAVHNVLCYHREQNTEHGSYIHRTENLVFS